MKNEGRIPSARDLMEDFGVTFRRDTELAEAIVKLARTQVSAAPVVDDGMCLLGMLTEKDCIRVLSVSAFHHPHGGKVGDYMSVVRLAIAPGMDLFRIAELFLENNFPTLPVVDQGRLVGCITRQHVLRGITALTEIDRSEVEGIEEEAVHAVRRPSSIGNLQTLFASYTKDQLVRLLGRRG